MPDGNGGDANALGDWKAFGVNAGDEGTDAQVEKPQLALGVRPTIGVCAALATALVADNDGSDVEINDDDVDNASSLYPNSGPKTFLLNASDIFL